MAAVAEGGVISERLLTPHDLAPVVIREQTPVAGHLLPIVWLPHSQLRKALV